MGRYLEKRESSMADEIGVKTRAKTALSMAASTTSVSPSSKKIKKASATTRRYNVHRLRNRRPFLTPSKDYSGCSSSEVVVSDESPANDASCSSNIDNVASSLIFADPEQVESAQTSSTHLNHHNNSNNEDRKECKVEDAESEKLASTRKTNDEDHDDDAKSLVQMLKMPSDFEIEDFFATAEKDLQKRFTERYNYDVVKDVPLEGRFEWVQIKP